VVALDLGTASVLLTAGSQSDAYDASWRLVPPFGPVPPALSDVYPLTAEMPDRLGTGAYETAAAGVEQLVEANSETAFTLFHDDWPGGALDALPDRVTVDRLGDSHNNPE
jgi:7-cyano-7-deazaguanine tRNA-ribosyltransferase